MHGSTQIYNKKSLKFLFCKMFGIRNASKQGQKYYWANLSPVQASASLYKRGSLKNQSLQECATYTKNHHISELKKTLAKRWPISVQDATRIG